MWPIKVYLTLLEATVVVVDVVLVVGIEVIVFVAVVVVVVFVNPISHGEALRGPPSAFLRLLRNSDSKDPKFFLTFPKSKLSKC